MPTKKPRVSWILKESTIEALLKASEEEHRPIAWQADLILREWLSQRGYLPPD